MPGTRHTKRTAPEAVATCALARKRLSIGFAAGLIPRGIYVQVIVLVLATTLITPALLRLVFARREAAVEPSLVPLPLESATQQEFVSPA